ncbi:hypothetical protein Brsp06_01062 [Brucella sp. NBRC 13694]|jgi:hypothetical protein|nr:hypothetical protein [Brucella anthropi]NIH76204.1 hypothetical protein [Ochrobactrum sp. P20RRXII]SUA60343.1 Uncharacterised protein [Brucella anthropi]
MSKTECFPEALEEGRPGVSAQAPLGGVLETVMLDAILA